MVIELTSSYSSEYIIKLYFIGGFVFTEHLILRFEISGKKFLLFLFFISNFKKWGKMGIVLGLTYIVFLNM
jgi:hypothetical protein